MCPPPLWVEVGQPWYREWCGQWLIPFFTALPLRIGAKGSPETSITSYQTTQILGLHRDGSMKLRTFFFFSPVQTGPGALTASCRVGSAALLPGVKRPGCEFDHPPSSCAEVKNGWSRASAPHVCLHWHVVPFAVWAYYTTSPSDIARNSYE